MVKKLHDQTAKEHAAYETLELATTSGENVTLHASQLQAWLDTMHASLKKTPEQPLKDVLEHAKDDETQGLTEAQNTIKFLKSPEGLITLTMIGAHLADLAEKKHRLTKMMVEALLHRHYLMAFLHTMRLRRKAVHARHVRELTEQIEHQLLKSHEENAKKYTQASVGTAHPVDKIKTATETYLEAAKTLLDQKLEQAKLLENALQQVQNQLEAIDKKYDLYQAAANDAEMIPKPNMTVAEIKAKIAALEEALIKTQEKFIDELDQLDQLSLNDNLVDAKADQEIRRKLNESIADNIRIAALKDWVDVIENNKTLYTEEGYRTTDFEKAAYIVSADEENGKEIVVDNGKLYLLPRNEKLTAENKEKAAADFVKLSPDILMVKDLLRDNKQKERLQHVPKQQALAEQSETLQQEILSLANIISQLQAATATANLAIQQQQPAAQNAAISAPKTAQNASPAPAPATPKPSLPNSASNNPHTVFTKRSSLSPKSTPQLLQDSVDHILELMKASPSPRAIQWLQANVSNTRNKQLIDLVSGLKPGKPIPAALMGKLHELPDVSGLLATEQSPSKLVLEPHPEPEQTKPTAPAPFSTKFNPFDKQNGG